MRRQRALDIGSGHNPVRDSGWNAPGDLSHLEFTNMDGHYLSPDKTDIAWRMEDLPWPFQDDTFDFAFARHSLEHVPRAALVGVMREIHRVCRDGAFVHIRVPYWNSEAFAGDPTHWNMFCETTFRHFCLGGALGTDYYVPALFKACVMEFRFQPKFWFLPKAVLRELMHLWCGVCDEMWVTLEVIKDKAARDLHGFLPWEYRPHYKYRLVKR